jgi:hypothetical protein
MALSLKHAMRTEVMQAIFMVIEVLSPYGSFEVLAGGLSDARGLKIPPTREMNT